MENLFEIVMEFKLTKDSLKKGIRHHLTLYYPDLLNQLSGKLIGETLIYCQGYMKCFEFLGQSPMNINEIEDLIVREGIDFVVQRLKS